MVLRKLTFRIISTTRQFSLFPIRIVSWGWFLFTGPERWRILPTGRSTFWRSSSSIWRFGSTAICTWSTSPTMIGIFRESGSLPPSTICPPGDGHHPAALRRRKKSRHLRGALHHFRHSEKNTSITSAGKPVWAAARSFSIWYEILFNRQRRQFASPLHARKRPGLRIDQQKFFCSDRPSILIRRKYITGDHIPLPLNCFHRRVPHNLQKIYRLVHPHIAILRAKPDRRCT